MRSLGGREFTHAALQPPRSSFAHMDQLRAVDALGSGWLAALLVLAFGMLAWVNMVSPRQWVVLARSFGALRLGRHRLREELDLARRYLSIEQLRLGDRLTVDWQVDENLPLFLALPTLTLQPLVENAVLHGVAQLPAGGTVSLHARRDGRGVTIRVRNPLASPVAADTPGRTQDNIRNRLRHTLGSSARLSLDGDNGHYTVTLWLPLS